MPGSGVEPTSRARSALRSTAGFLGSHGLFFLATAIGCAVVVVLTWALVASRSATAEARAAHVQARQPAAKRVSA